MPRSRPKPSGANAPTPPARIKTAEQLTDRLADILLPGSSIVCVGNDLRGDDGVGVYLAHALSGNVPWDVHDARTAPESFLMKIAGPKPASVLIVDALDFGAAPGQIDLIGPARLTGQGPSTHGPAPIAFVEALQMVHPCRCELLGIQPEQTRLDAPLSDTVRQAADLVVRVIRTLAMRAP